MVKRLLRLSRAPGTDASDALGVAICAAHHYRLPAALKPKPSGNE
jgi:crossover junction endodeoxyribonuclease RuvC